MSELYQETLSERLKGLTEEIVLAELWADMEKNLELARSKKALEEQRKKEALQVLSLTFATNGMSVVEKLEIAARNKETCCEMLLNDASFGHNFQDVLDALNVHGIYANYEYGAKSEYWEVKLSW